jgi:hypothetical protein
VRHRLEAALHHLGLSRVAALVILGYTVWCLTFERLLPAGEALVHFPDHALPYIASGAIALIVYAFACELQRPKRLIHERRYWSGLGWVLGGLMLYSLFIYSFGFVKSLIPLFHPYGIDPLLHRLETALFFGHSPSIWWVETMPYWSVAALAKIYMPAWIVLTHGYFLWFLCQPASRARTQFVSCFFLLWVIAGILAAIAFSSVGPIYYDYFFDDAAAEGYRAMRDGLLAQNDALTRLVYVDIRQMLLDFYADGTITNLNAISAMPSLHTGMAFLIALHAHVYLGRLWRWVMYLFALTIFLGSFVLGWHYVLDSVASALLVWLVWALNRHSLKASPSF